LALRELRPDTTVVEVGCPAFVPLIEAGNFDDPRLREAATALSQGPAERPAWKRLCWAVPTTPCLEGAALA